MSSDELIFGLNHLTGVGFHNVGELLVGASSETIDHINGHYGQRCGHIPDQKNVGVIAHNTSEIQTQIGYISGLIGRTISIVDWKNITPNTLVVPYINMPQTEAEIKSAGADVWGLPGKLTGLLKNKAECHRLIKKLDIDGFTTPNFSICEFGQIAETSSKVLTKVELDYSKTGMTQYPIGVMIRAAMSDGQYGGIYVTADNHGEIIVAPDGKPSTAKYKSWSEALNFAQNFISSGMNPEVDNHAVVTRFMDLKDSPGMSMIFVNGQPTSLGLNGQVKDGSACVGTSSYQPKDRELQIIKNQQEEVLSKNFTDFIITACKQVGVNPAKLNAAVNVDWMIPGNMENEFQRRLGNKPGITVAEINPRFTNWTDALLLVMWTKGLPQTTANMLDTINHGVLTSDHYPISLPKNMTTDTLRHQIAELDNRLKTDDTRIILRMPDHTNPGVVFSGNTKLAMQEFNKILQ